MQTKRVSKIQGLFGAVSLTCLLALSSGCKEETDASPSSTPTNPPVGIVDDAAGFYVRAQYSPDYTYYTHRGAESGTTPATYAGSLNWTHDCVASAGEDIMCYVEAAEYDLFFNGLTLQHNFPSSMCYYSEISMPWYFRYPAGYGPSVAAFDNVTTTVAGVSATAVADVTNTAKGVAYCPFDYSSKDPNLPNCCEGSYTMITTTQVPAGQTAPPPTSTQEDWGGSRSACAAGPAMDLMPKNPAGFPMTEVKFVKGVGANGVYTIASPISKLLPNYYAANYFDIASAKDYSSLVFLNGSNQSDYVPAMYQPANPYVSGATAFAIPGSDDGSGATINATGFLASPALSQPYYEYVCYDNYREVIARIRLMVRSWDVLGTMAAGTQYAPNRGSQAGVGAGSPYHDFAVWGDLFFNYTSTTGTSMRTNFSFTTSGCGAGTAYPCSQGYGNPFTWSASSGFPY